MSDKPLVGSVCTPPRHTTFIGARSSSASLREKDNLLQKKENTQVAPRAKGYFLNLLDECTDDLRTLVAY